MNKQIIYYNWRERILSTVKQKINDDIIIINNPDVVKSIEAPLRLDVTTAIYLLNGESHFIFNMKKYVAKAPCIIVLLADQIYQPLTHSEDINISAIVMSQNFSEDLFQKHETYTTLYKSVIEHPIIEIGNDIKIFKTYFTLLSILLASPDSSFKLEAAKHLTLSMFYGYTYQKHQVENIKTKNASTYLYLRFEKLLYANYKKERETKFYAEKLCVTPKHLTQTIKKVTGKTPHEHIDNFVITESKALLSSTNMTIQEISYHLNFSSQSLFGKYFKRIVGISPKLYKEQIKL